MKKQKLLTQKEYAHRRGVSQQSINRAIHMGKIPTHAGRIDPSEADRVLAEEVTAKTGAVTLASANLRWRLATAILRELDVEIRRGALVEVAYVERCQAEINGNITKTLLAIPAKLTPRLTDLTSPAKIKLILEAEVRQCLSQLREVAVPSGAANAM